MGGFFTLAGKLRNLVKAVAWHPKKTPIVKEQ